MNCIKWFPFLLHWYPVGLHQFMRDITGEVLYGKCSSVWILLNAIFLHAQSFITVNIPSFQTLSGQSCVKKLCLRCSVQRYFISFVFIRNWESVNRPGQRRVYGHFITCKSVCAAFFNNLCIASMVPHLHFLSNIQTQMKVYRNNCKKWNSSVFYTNMSSKWEKPYKDHKCKSCSYNFYFVCI